MESLDIYYSLGSAIQFYLSEAFRNINSAANEDASGIIFQENLLKIDVSPEDRLLLSKIDTSLSAIDTLRRDISDHPVITEVTLQKMLLAWEEAKNIVETSKFKFRPTYSLSSISVLGHLNNLAFFIETITNRHLLFLLHTEEITGFEYNRLTDTGLLSKLLFIFKTDKRTEKINLDHIAHLITLRNKTVHFSPQCIRNFKVDIKSLIEIWHQLIKIIRLFEVKEGFADFPFSQFLSSEVKDFKIRWM